MRGRAELLWQHPTPSQPLPTCHGDQPRVLGAPGLLAHRRSSGLRRRGFVEGTVQQKPFLQGLSLLEG